MNSLTPADRKPAGPERLLRANRHPRSSPAGLDRQLGIAPIAELPSDSLPGRTGPDGDGDKTGPALSTCAHCQTEIPGSETLCAICQRNQNHVPAGLRTLAHWLLLLLILLVLFGLGEWLGT